MTVPRSAPVLTEPWFPEPPGGTPTGYRQVVALVGYPAGADSVVAPAEAGA